MYIFGGILELTKELNELLEYNFDTNSFQLVGHSHHNEDLAHGSPGRGREEDSPGMKKGMHDKNNTFGRSPTKTGKGLSPTKLRRNTHKSPSKKKEADHDVKKESGLASPTSISMQNSFIIKNADESFDAYYTQMKKRKQGGLGLTGLDPLSAMPSNTGNISPGMKESHFGVVPGNQSAARDGHSTEISDKGIMFVFGGDRHHMPFNDLYLMKIE